MAFIPVLLLMLFAKEVKCESRINLGSLLSPEGSHSSWESSSGLFAFGFYPHGNGFAVGIWLVSVTLPDKTIVWTANRDSPPLSSNSTLHLINTGLRLFLSGKEGQYLITNFTSITWASMLDSGNYVLYDDTNSVVWQSFDHPTDTILGGQNLSTKDRLVSSVSKSDHSSGRYVLIMQDDGNLVAYPVNSPSNDGDPYWASNTKTFNQLSLNVSGFLCLRGYSGPGLSFSPCTNNYLPCIGPTYSHNYPQCFNNRSSPGKKSQNTSAIYRATLDENGNLRLYEHQFESNGSSHIQQLWSTSLGRCQVKGVCGFNSYCSNVTGDPVCECFPGFVFDPSKSKGNDNMSLPLDCVLAHSIDGCLSNEDSMVFYNVTQLENIYWGDGVTPYSVSPMNKEECEKSLKEDCDCMAVLYSQGNCKKYRLPLLYGKKVQDSSTVAFIKMPSGIVASQIPNDPILKPRIVVDDKTRLIRILAFTLGSISLLSMVFAVFIFFTYKRQVYRYKALSTSEDLGLTEACSLRSFSFDELEKSTRGFTEEIGRGSFGAVYRGTTGDSNRSIAVKRLERTADEAGEREFQTEITAIARTHHKNLVKLIGFCINGSRKLLVYEYVSNGSLAKLLFNGEKHISWRDRLKIALDVARGVLYLHEECEVRIIHCNINPRNILMDEVWTAKISDFGLARRLKADPSRMKKKEDDETSKYLAPEWHKDAPVSVKLDIYSFGVVLLEIVCRRSNIEVNVSSPEEILLSSWVYQCFVAGQLNNLVTEEEEEGVDWKISERMVKVALWCVQDDPSLRPSIRNVILMLEGLKDISIPPSPAHMAK